MSVDLIIVSSANICLWGRELSEGPRIVCGAANCLWDRELLWGRALSVGSSIVCGAENCLWGQELSEGAEKTINFPIAAATHAPWSACLHRHHLRNRHDLHHLHQYHHLRHRHSQAMRVNCNTDKWLFLPFLPTISDIH